MWCPFGEVDIVAVIQCQKIPLEVVRHAVIRTAQVHAPDQVQPCTLHSDTATIQEAVVIAGQDRQLTVCFMRSQRAAFDL